MWRMEVGDVRGRARIGLLARHSALNPLHLHRRIETLLVTIYAMQKRGRPCGRLRIT